ncbi:MAG TPA: AAC(3) family N-acetyltransferase [Fluviicola sp.]|nr:AAC(3) family N-acetyltransferase [Fluviicola sp.]
MSSFRDLLRSITPQFLLDRYREQKKEAVRSSIAAQREAGEGLTKEALLEQLRGIGIVEGDTLLVHSSLSKIGFVEGGPQTVIDALLSSVGDSGHVLMPNSPNAGYQLEYIRQLEVFDVANAPSALGIITELFRKHPQAIRSVSATEPVSCIGPNAIDFVGEHLGEETPYTSKSPFYKVAAAGGKILYIGVTLANAGTSLHVLEDAVESFKFPVYYPELFTVNVKLETGEEKTVKTKVHNPEWSAKRRCDELIPLFEKTGAFQKVTIGNAPTLLVDAKKMLEVMISEYEQRGVTMYTPNGSN